MKILIAEDEITIANSLKKNFADEGHDALIANNGENTINQIQENDFDAILLDWRMPKLSGLEVCNKLRNEGFNKPIILLTALADISNKVEALNAGADDYITKPFSFEEVMARIEAVVRRYKSTTRTIIFDKYKLDLISRIVQTPDEQIRLTDKEFELLKYFLENKGSIITKERLCRDVWELPFTPTTNMVEVTIKNLRKKIEDESSKKYIKTIYGEGYLFLTD